MNQPAESFPVEIDPFYVEDLRQMARARNYQRWQFQMVAPFLTGEVLEIGGGIGNFTPQLASVAQFITSLEPNEYCFNQLREKIAPLKNAAAYRVTVESLHEVIPPGKRFDAIVLMNVLEGLRDADLPDWLLVAGALYNRVWNALTGQETLARAVKNEGVVSVAFSPDGRRMALPQGT